MYNTPGHRLFLRLFHDASQAGEESDSFLRMHLFVTWCPTSHAMRYLSVPEFHGHAAGFSRNCCNDRVTLRKDDGAKCLGGWTAGKK